MYTHASKMLQNLNMPVRIFLDFLYTCYLYSSPLLKGKEIFKLPKIYTMPKNNLENLMSNCALLDVH